MQRLTFTKRHFHQECFKVHSKSDQFRLALEKNIYIDQEKGENSKYRKKMEQSEMTSPKVKIQRNR